LKTNRPLLFSLGLIAATLCCFDTAAAQTTVVATPPQLTFNTQTGVTTPVQTVLLSTASGTPNVTATAYSDTGWLTVTSSSSTTPDVLTISIGAGAPTSGVDVGFINVVSGSTNLSIPVTLNANSNGGPSPISTTLNSLSFVFPAGDTSAATQTVNLSSSSSSVTSFTATPITNNGGSWLSVNPNAGSLPGSLQVTVNPVALINSPGTFNAAVAINAPGTNGISIPVLVTIQGVPTLTVSPAGLSFGYQTGTSGPLPETLTLSSSTGANVSFTATAQDTNCGSWIVLNQNSGATPSTLSVQVNTSGLAVGNCTGQINISASGASNPSITVPVTLLVSNLPLIQAPSTGATFTYQTGGATPAPQNVQITSSTSGLSFTASASPTPSSAPNFLQITPATGTTPQALTLTISPTVLPTLGPGTYTETVTLTGSGAGNSPQSFPVTLTVSSNPILTSSVPSLNFNYQTGQTAPSNQTITISSSGAPVNYQVAVNTTSCAGFLTATPASGSTFGGQNQIVVTANPQGLTPQVCSGNVTVTVPGSTTTPLVIPVTFNVSNSALLSVSVPAINITAVAGAAAMTQTVSVTSTNNSALAFSSTATTNPAGLTWLSVTPNAGSTPNNLQVTINPTNLGVGTYSGSIIVSSTTSGIPPQTIPVTLNVVASTAVAGETKLTFTQAAGGTAPDSQSFQISGVPTGATIGAISTVLSGSGWLSASASGNTVTVTANGSQLAQGTYSGVVTVIVPGAGASPLYIPVTLDVTSATSAITLSASTASFNVLTGSMSIPGSTTVQVTSSSTGSVPFTATFVPGTGGNFLTVTPASGNTPATLTLAVNAAVSSTLAAGTYTGDVQVSSGTGAVQTVKVTLLVSPTGTPVVLSITSGASIQPGAVSPGEIVTMFGNGIGPATPSTGTSFQPTATGTVPTTLANVSVTFNNVAAPLIFVAPGQINAIVPYQVAGQTSVPVVVTNNGTASATFTVPVTATTPSIFSLGENGSGQGAILNSDLSVNGTANPVSRGSFIAIYATGEGQLVPAGTTGCITGASLPLPKPVGNVSVTIGGQTASLSYAGEAPDLVCGVMQINAMIPSNIAAGAQTVGLTIGTATNTNQTITVAVK
jgi:uncharacterized protein (TIGR03437 family)